MGGRGSFHFSSAGEKREFTRDLFHRLAPRYEMVNKIISLGQMDRWRRVAAAAAQVPPGGRVLDVATGAGGLSFALLQMYPDVRAVGVDMVPAMMREGRARPEGRSVLWTAGDGLRLPFPDRSFDAVVNGFMLRNVTSVEATLAEQFRVVRPGGRVVCLEMTWPRHPVRRQGFRLYFAGLVPLIGWLLTGDKEAYSYLPRSVQTFIPPDELASIMEKVGLKEVSYRLMMMETVAVHTGVRYG